MIAAIDWLENNNHSPTNIELMRESISRYNAYPYYTWVTELLDNNGLPIPVPLNDPRFTQTGTQYGLGFGVDDYYRDFVWCDHNDGPSYTTGVTIPAPAVCSSPSPSTTHGFWVQYTINRTTNQFSGLQQCSTDGYSTCYSDRRDIAQPNFGAPDTATVPEAIIIP